ncbi:uncharacterized protein LY89DRAFT_704835 [Mollisia scopiformis]|uniref:Uncharacterized protein n=1 Tax=Mollisia scopiformis TaxID=149040 RepID=A0A194XPR8_MOLSC|nr:uncharacterized protein LY89DRAFT_704835 [Mollisia scopiformis]KUJ22188.1 hypothetical protein LY89DRAFT_704835 [Mollisia scopiformis]
MDSSFTILTPNAMLGYGYREDHFWYGVEKYNPAAIIVDSGSTDGGPYKLGMNKMTCGRESYIRDLSPILEACFYRKIKVLIGSVGGDGSDKHVEEMLEIVRGIAESNGYSFKIATIRAGMDRTLIKERIRSNRCSPCGPLDPLTVKDVDAAVDVVAQMGAEPFMQALKDDPDIILGGRSYDPAPFAAFCMSRGVDPGVAWHMGKIMECGGICAVPKGRSMIATMRKDSFDLIPLSPLERCTPLSVASHTLGAVFSPTPVYQIKLEGVELLGYRTIFIGGIRDPILISQIDDFLEKVRQYTHGLFPALDKSEKCRLNYHIYGRNAVMGPLETEISVAYELGIMGEVMAETQELSHTITNNVRTSLLHMPYEGQLATTGNFASPLSPHEQEAGAVFKFSLYHLIDLNAGEELDLFPIRFHQIGTTSPVQEEKGHLTQSQLEFFTSTKPLPIARKETTQDAVAMMNIAKVIRSKNSGPFELTLDIMFDDQESYERVKKADLLTNSIIKRLYRVEDHDILTNMYFEPALAWKCTLKRPWAQGSFGERDTLGTQQHAPLLTLLVPASGKKALMNGKLNGKVNGTI